jgi:hypothetical protein
VAEHAHDKDIALTYAPATIETERGVLELHESGVRNPDTKEFAAINKVTGGTGKFVRYSGKLMMTGYADGKLLITGTMCRP